MKGPMGYNKQGFSKGGLPSVGRWVRRPLSCLSPHMHARHDEALSLTGPLPQNPSRNPPLPIHGVSPTNGDAESAAKVDQEFRRACPLRHKFYQKH